MQYPQSIISIHSYYVLYLQGLTMRFRDKRILLVEDQPLIALSNVAALEKRGYRVKHVANGREAISQALSVYNGVDLILMDIDLGEGIDGTEAARLILRGKDIPILFLSSHTETEIVEKTEDISSYGYVVKDSGLVVLDASIKMAFKLFDAKMKEQEREAALQRSEVKFRVLFEQMQLAIYFHLDNGMIVDVNEAACSLSGFSREELLKMNIFDLHGERDVSGTAAELIREKWASWKSGERVSLKTRHRHKDGSVLKVEVTTGRIDFGQEHIMCAVVRREQAK